MSRDAHLDDATIKLNKLLLCKSEMWLIEGSMGAVNGIKHMEWILQELAKFYFLTTMPLTANQRHLDYSMGKF